jgi:hypothetical protein
MSDVSTEQKPVKDESSWRQELEQLDRLLEGRATESEAKQYAKSELARHDAIVNTIETAIAETRAVEAAGSPYLSLTDRLRISRKMEALQYRLENAQKARERSIRLNGAGIKAAKDCDKQRPRWNELKKRRAAVEAASWKSPSLSFN